MRSSRDLNNDCMMIFASKSENNCSSSRGARIVPWAVPGTRCRMPWDRRRSSWTRHVTSLSVRNNVRTPRVRVPVTAAHTLLLMWVLLLLLLLLVVYCC